VGQNSAGTSAALRRGVAAIGVGLVRSTICAGCALIIPVCIAVLPSLAAFHLLGSPWSWSNPWSWIALVLIMVSVTLVLAHPVAGIFRGLILTWTGVRIDSGFGQHPDPVKLSTGYWWNGRSYERSHHDAVMDLRISRVKEPAYWREVRWVGIATIMIVPVCALATAALVVGIIMCAIAEPWSIAGGVALVIVAAAAAPWGWRIVAPLAQRWLAAPVAAPDAMWRSERADLSAAHDAEIRRIERDLHDGAQARLVAVGLDLAAAERLIRTDPEKAAEVLRTAREGARGSLNDLRDLVRGVYPPVLIERGLVPAIRSAALDSPLTVEVAGPDDLRLPSPLAAAIYFAVCELLANVAKHSHVREASVKINVEPPSVEVVVADDGPGGAALRPGGGLDGVRRRLEVFDATLKIDSPAGGPTTITVRAPCESF
jgi:signal transduction histidine kinase